MNNKQKVMFAKLSVMFVLAGLAKVAQKLADDKIDEHYSDLEITE